MSSRALSLALAVVALLLASATARAAAVPDCCFVATGPLSVPVPAGDVRILDAFAPTRLVARRGADGTIFTASWGNGEPGFGVPVAAGTWPYRQWWAGDLNGDALVDLLGRDGTDIMLSLGRPGGGWAPPRRWATLPRRFSVVRIGDLWAQDLGPTSDDLVALDPRTGELRWLMTEFYADDLSIFMTAQEMGHWPRGTTLQLAPIDLGLEVDAIGVDPRTGRIRIAWDANATHGVARDETSYRIPPHADFAIADVNGDQRGDLIYRPRGSDAVYVRRAYESPPPTDVTAKVVHFRFHSARRWGTWDRRMPLATTALGPLKSGLIGRDPDTGRIVGARSSARLYG